jgi:hypothetical protein
MTPDQILRARSGRPTKSIRSLYWNFGTGYTEQEMTIPDKQEIVLSAGTVAADVPTRSGLRPASSMDTWGIVVVIMIAMVLLWVLGKS